jgi:hypothetical protein
MLTYACMHQRLQVHACRLLTYADVCLHSTVLADVCWRMLFGGLSMLTYADVCLYSTVLADVCWRMLFGGLSMLTYADVCWRMPVFDSTSSLAAWCNSGWCAYTYVPCSSNTGASIYQSINPSIYLSIYLSIYVPCRSNRGVSTATCTYAERMLTYADVCLYMPVHVPCRSNRGASIATCMRRGG